MSEKKINPELAQIVNVLLTNPNHRRIAYALLGLAAFALAGFTTYAGATSMATPDWVVGLSAVGNLIFGGGFIMATANSPSPTPTPTPVIVEEVVVEEEVKPSVDIQAAVDEAFRG